MSKILIDRAVVEQALDFCEFAWRDVPMNDYAFERLGQTIATFRAALAEQAEQELVRGEWQGYTWNPYAIPQPAKPAEQEPRPCHVFNVTKNGSLTEWEPTTMAFALPDGKYALYTAPHPAKPAEQGSVAAGLSEELRYLLVAISEAIADQDDRAAQAILRGILAAPQPAKRVGS